MCDCIPTTFYKTMAFQDCVKLSKPDMSLVSIWKSKPYWINHEVNKSTSGVRSENRVLKIFKMGEVTAPKLNDSETNGEEVKEHGKSIMKQCYKM